MVHHALIGLVVLASAADSAPSTANADSAAHQQACVQLCAKEFTDNGQRECLGRERMAAQRELDALVAAVTRSERDREVLAAFNETQSAWLAYCTADCYAVGVNWTNGSGRRAAEEFCRVDHIRRRAFDIWLNYHLESLSEPRIACNDQRPDA